MSDLIELTIERPVAGGRMLAHHDEVVVLVSGTLPGERVIAKVERRTPRLLFATVQQVIEPAPTRRQAHADVTCGGLDYAHIDYAEQLRLKAAIVADAFRRIGKRDIDAPIDVRPSPERGYRLRARLHVQDGRAGFFREGTHELCDAGASGQLLPEAVDAASALVRSLGPHAALVTDLVISENVRATERVLHLIPREGSERSLVIPTALPPAVTGLTVWHRNRVATHAGLPTVTDTAVDLFDADSPVPSTTRWQRHAASFFQGNRYLVGDLVRHVLNVTQGERVADIYAGVGLFAVALAASGSDVVAVEGDPLSGADLSDHAAAATVGRIEAVRLPVEVAIPRLNGRFDTVIVDPPRTGLSPKALPQVIGMRARRIVYVSCDPATLARDAARFSAGDYRLEQVRAFDMFPNTSHVETVAVFSRA